MSYLLKNEKRHKNPLGCAEEHNQGDFSLRSNEKKWSSSRQEVPACHHSLKAFSDTEAPTSPASRRHSSVGFEQRTSVSCEGWTVNALWGEAARRRKRE